jgi:hypothetical protein
MRYARWRLRSLLILVAGLTVLCAGVVKWKRFTELRDQIAKLSREENRLLEEYHHCQWMLQLPSPCGNVRRHAEACMAVAAERRRSIEECEREINHIW